MDDFGPLQILRLQCRRIVNGWLVVGIHASPWSINRYCRHCVHGWMGLNKRPDAYSTSLSRGVEFLPGIDRCFGSLASGFTTRKGWHPSCYRFCAWLAVYGHSNPAVKRCVVLPVRSSEDVVTSDFNFWIYESRISGCQIFGVPQ